MNKNNNERKQDRPGSVERKNNEIQKQSQFKDVKDEEIMQLES